MDCIVHGVAKSWKRYVYQNIFLMFPQITDVIIWAFCFVLFQSCCLAFPFLEGWFSKMCFLKLSLVHSPLPFTLYYLICMLKSEEHSPPFSFTTPCKTYSLRNMPQKFDRIGILSGQSHRCVSVGVLSTSKLIECCKVMQHFLILISGVLQGVQHNAALSLDEETDTGGGAEP